MKKKLKTPWRLWCYALGTKAGKNDREANIVAIIRTLILASYLITNGFIVANAIRHWNDVEYQNKYNQNSQTNENVFPVPRRS